MLKWVASVYKRTRTRFRRFFGVRIADSISEQERDTCERYGEQAISTMLAGGFNPSTQDLQAIYANEESKKHARDWLTESADLREFKDRWVSGRDLFLELVVIALIGWEIWLSYKGDSQQNQNFKDQQAVLQNLQTSSQATANTLTSLKKTTEAMNQSVQRSAAATEANAATSAQSLRMSERGYLACVVSMPTPPKAGDKLHFVATVTNAGKGLATDVVIFSRMASVPKGTSAEIAKVFAGDKKSPNPSKGPLAVNQNLEQAINSPSILTEEDVANIADQKFVVYQFVEVTYKDLFNRNHKLEVCTYYYALNKQIFICPTLNKAD